MHTLSSRFSGRSVSFFVGGLLLGVAATWMLASFFPSALLQTSFLGFGTGSWNRFGGQYWGAPPVVSTATPTPTPEIVAVVADQADADGVRERLARYLEATCRAVDKKSCSANILPILAQGVLSEGPDGTYYIQYYSYVGPSTANGDRLAESNPANWLVRTAGPYEPQRLREMLGICTFANGHNQGQIGCPGHPWNDLCGGLVGAVNAKSADDPECRERQEVIEECQRQGGSNCSGGIYETFNTTLPVW